MKRNKNTRKQIPGIIIACEDSVSSPEYFKQIVAGLKKDRKISAKSFVIVPHKCNNPSGVLSDLLNYKNEENITYKDFDSKWIVIDRDAQNKCGGSGHSAQDFNNAITRAKSKGVKVAYANDSFELWYLLHFNYIDTLIMRDKILENVIYELKIKFPTEFKNLTDKNIKTKEQTQKIYKALLDIQQIAIKNAENLLSYYGENHNPGEDNPSTTIHKLIIELNKL
ncbi:RloB family protein [Campylobacter ureolyticus]|uniref:RloB family protein n=1 Tax=Campylobacter ureolyticus TaxID=827 RepID=UPI0022B3C867|nr:RloB family protein [Campylobacter ureolyticus]MCZ6105694.1 RloB family protein [Campylobacter ureolyticus]